jgi:hypothetical protein
MAMLKVVILLLGRTQHMPKAGILVQVLLVLIQKVVIPVAAAEQDMQKAQAVP